MNWQKMRTVALRNRSIALRPRGPFDLALSLRAAASLFPIVEPAPAILRTPIHLGGETAIVEVSQAGVRASGLLYASSTARWRTSGDIGLRRVVGHYVANGRRLTAAELEDALAQFKPFRGLAAFYLAIHWRLSRVPSGPMTPAKVPPTPR